MERLTHQRRKQSGCKQTSHSGTGRWKTSLKIKIKNNKHDQILVREDTEKINTAETRRAEKSLDRNRLENIFCNTVLSL